MDSASAEKLEYVNGQIRAMAGAMPEHNKLVRNLGFLVGAPLFESDAECQIMNQDQRVRLEETDSFVYPDMTVFCEAMQLTMETPPSLNNPSIIFEVLPPSTELYDRTEKLPAYMRIEALQEIVFVSSRKMAVEHYLRKGQDWIFQPILTEADQVLYLPTIQIRVPLATLYKQVNMPPVSINS